jgi:hypothetical protein
VIEELAKQVGEDMANLILTGTYSTDGYRVILSPEAGYYLRIDGVNGNVSPKEADAYGAIVINDVLFLDQLEYTKIR